MTWIDWTILAVLLFTLLQGLRRGPVIGLLSTLGLIGGFVAASVWYPLLADVLTQSLRLDRAWAGTAAFLSLLGAIYVAIGVLATTLLWATRLSVPARLVGGLVGVVKGTALAMVLLAVVLASPLGDPVGRDANRSRLTPYAVRAQHFAVSTLARLLPPNFHLPGANRTRF